jgi:hypothetical protein
MVELLSDILTKSVPGTSRIHAPSSTVIRIGPKKITHRSFMGHFLESFECANVIKRLNTGRQASMQAEKLIFDHCGEREVVEQFSKTLPDV